jgi:hypothetical protein
MTILLAFSVMCALVGLVTGVAITAIYQVKIKPRPTLPTNRVHKKGAL